MHKTHEVDEEEEERYKFQIKNQSVSSRSDLFNNFAYLKHEQMNYKEFLG